MQEKRNQMIGVMVTETMKQQIQKIADEKSWTISQTVFKLLEKQLKEENHASDS